MLALRRHILVRIFVCVLLTWAAADLLIPNFCSAEAAVQSTQADQDLSGQPSPLQNTSDRDDCFCCCAHADYAPLAVVLVPAGAPEPLIEPPVSHVAAGMPRGVYRPPQHA